MKWWIPIALASLSFLLLPSTVQGTTQEQWEKLEALYQAEAACHSRPRDQELKSRCAVIRQITEKREKKHARQRRREDFETIDRALRIWRTE